MVVWRPERNSLSYSGQENKKESLDKREAEGIKLGLAMKAGKMGESEEKLQPMQSGALYMNEMVYGLQRGNKGGHENTVMVNWDLEKHQEG